MAKKILVTDDNQDILATLTFKLRGHGYQVLTAGNGKEAIDIAQKELPDLILLDFMMPVMDGSETAIQLKANDKTKAIPIIFLTALIEENDMINNKLGKNMALPKSVKFADLFKAIDEILEKTQKP